MTLQALYEEALGSHRRGDLATAERLYRQLLEAAPSGFPARHMLGVLCAQQGRNEEAALLIAAAVKANPRSADALTNYGNVLNALGRHEEALASFDSALALGPDAIALNNKGSVLHKIGRLDEALDCYARAIALKPDYAEAVNKRGVALHELSQFPEAVAAFDQALALHPGDAQSLGNRSVSLWSSDKFAEALASADAALAADPMLAPTWSHRGNVLRALDRPQDALESYDRAIALDPGYAQAHLNKSYCLLFAGRWREGWPQFEWRKRLPVPIGARTFPQPLWTGAEDIRGKTLFVYAEQGLGDTIQFFRYCALARERGAQVIFAPQNGLARLLKSAGPGVTLIDQDAVPSHFDFHIPLMSLPLAFNTTVETIPTTGPYLKAESAKVEEWSGITAKPGFRVGIAWRGNERGAMRGRSFPLESLERLARLPGLRLISLQKDAGRLERQTIAPKINLELLDDRFDSGPDAFIDTAAILQQLDLVITADTSIAHLAGALGLPTWIALKHLPDWRWLTGRADTPWYPSVTLYRQAVEGDWASVFDAMQSSLAARIADRA